MEIISTIIIGAIAGWLGSTIFKGSSLGLFGNILIGIIGSFVGNWSLDKLGVSLGTGWIGAILTGAIGALIILFLLNLIFKKRM
ncbi:MAG: GlsB/YeaQ/YmgE family stress response membrane protein [Flavobacteriaceae bacterium]